MQWFYANEKDEEIGPFDDAGIRALIETKTITGATFVWREGQADWVPAEQTELKAMLPQSPPPAADPSSSAQPSPGASGEPTPSASPSCDSPRDESNFVYPANPPLRPGLCWLTLFLGPGTIQAFHGKTGMGVAGIVAFYVLWLILVNTLGADDSHPIRLVILVLTGLVLMAGSILDSWLTGRTLQRGHAVGKWQFCPTPPMSSKPIPPPVMPASPPVHQPGTVSPRTPPRSPAWMVFWGFLCPGLGQLLCGQFAKGFVLIVVCVVLGIVSFAGFFFYRSPTWLLVNPYCLLMPLGVVDAYKVASVLKSGKAVREWGFFPR